MEALAPMHLLIILLIVVLFFGGKKIPEMMRGLGEGIRSFKEGMSGQPPAPGNPPPQNTQAPQEQKK
jgi:sec-independent protein translocase protein TatA